MSIKDHGILVSMNVSKPQLTAKDDKATRDAEAANNASGAGQYRKDLYPKGLIAPIIATESAARAYIENNTYPWTRGERLLPGARFMAFMEGFGRYEIEFQQAVTVFLNNWTQVLQSARAQQGDMFDAGAYPDVSDLRAQFKFRLNFSPVTDASDFRVQLQEDELEQVRKATEAQVVENMNAMLRAPLERLREVVAHLQAAASKPDRTVTTAKGIDIRPPIFRDSVVENVIAEVALLHDFSEILPDSHLALAKDIADALPHPQMLRDDPARRQVAAKDMSALMARIDNMLGN